MTMPHREEKPSLCKGSIEVANIFFGNEVNIQPLVWYGFEPVVIKDSSYPYDHMMRWSTVLSQNALNSGFLNFSRVV